jgi:hypothetical protein
VRPDFLKKLIVKIALVFVSLILALAVPTLSQTSSQGKNSATIQTPTTTDWCSKNPYGYVRLSNGFQTSCYAWDRTKEPLATPIISGEDRQDNSGHEKQIVSTSISVITDWCLKNPDGYLKLTDGTVTNCSTWARMGKPAASLESGSEEQNLPKSESNNTSTTLMTHIQPGKPRVMSTPVESNIVIVKCGYGPDLGIHNAPSTADTEIDKVNCGDILISLGEESGFYKVRTKSGITGYISSVFISPKSNQKTITRIANSHQQIKPASQEKDSVNVAKGAGLSGKTLPTILVDTDEECRLSVDGEDQGLVESISPQKINVSIGEHVLKCVVESAPDLVWRKVVEVKDTAQVAAIISLKALHLQYQQATANVQQEKQKVEVAEEQKLAQAKATARASEERKQKVVQRLHLLQSEWHYDTENYTSYNNGCQAKVTSHRVLSLPKIDFDSGVISGTFVVNSDSNPTTASAFFAGMNHKNCAVLPSGESAISIVYQSYNARVTCGADDSQPCRVQVEAVSCEPKNCNTSYSFSIEVQGNSLISRSGNEVLQYSSR